MQKFVSEDDLNTFKGWMEYQGVDPTTLSVEELEMWRDSFYESQKRSSVTPKVGLMKLQFFPGEHRYAVAVRKGPISGWCCGFGAPRRASFSSSCRAEHAIGIVTQVITLTVLYM